MPGVTMILVVDDDKIGLKAMDNLLKSIGYDTISAPNGPEALDRLARDIGLVLLDVMMPGMDGFEVARRMRDHPECGDVPIIMVTGLTRKEDRLDAVRAGANDFISKPVDPVELEIRIASHLRLKEAQDKRRESDTRYRTLFENSPLGILYCNRNGEITEINTAASDLLGIRPSESGSPWNLFENGDLTSPRISGFLKGCLRSGKPLVDDFPIEKLQEKYVRLHVVPVRGGGGHISGLQTVSEDISGQKRADELNRRRTRLKAFAEMARGAVTHFSDALTTIAEGVVIGLRSMDSGAHAGARPALEKIQRAVQRASQTVGLLEKFARGYAKRDTPAWSSFDFSEAVGKALEATQPSWECKSETGSEGIHLECDLASECFVEGERNDIVELSTHLIRNAAEAMPQGGRLSIRTACEEDHVLFEVQDSGVGMSKRQIDQIGYPFRTSKQSHMGLGLAVSLGIIRRHHGTFWITSKVGRGTTFTTKFPLAAKPREEAEETTLDIQASNPKTLFVDPYDGIRSKFAGAPETKGPFYFARSVDEAVEVVYEKNIDAIVCSEVLKPAEISELSKRVSLFCAGRGTVRPPFILLTHDDGSPLSASSVPETSIDRILPSFTGIPELMLIVADEIRLTGSRPRIAGTLGQIDILDVVQMMMLSAQQLVLEIISNEGMRCLLYISKGEICHAKCGDMEGESAAYRALSLKSGSFSTLGWVEPERTTIAVSGQLILVEAARRRDEAERPPDPE